MRGRYTKLATGIAIFFILLLQGMWLYNAYKLARAEIVNKVNDCLNESVQTDIYSRLDLVTKALPNGSTISSDTISEKCSVFIPENVYLQESLVRFKQPLILRGLNRILSASLCRKAIFIEYSLCRVNSKTGEILESTLPGFNKSNVLRTKIFPVRKSEPIGVQVLFEPPYKAMFQQMTLLLIGSALMVVIVAFCVFYQIRIIIRQNKIAQLRQDFTYAMIHDMKTPLSSIYMGINMLKSGRLDNKPDKKEKYFDICMQESEHLLALTNRILTIAKLEQGELNLNKQIIDLPKLIKSLVDKFSINQSKEVVFTTSFSENLVSVVADYDYLKEAISNLIDNSIKYSHAKVCINIDCIKDDNCVLIKVKDNGFGIAHKDQTKIFEKFERAAATGKKKGATGFGLGLNYVLRVITAHGGNVIVSSIEGEFSEFTISLPMLIEEI
jgi:two-component system phosphate regulon sensor histidine kinase PhoR